MSSTFGVEIETVDSNSSLSPWDVSILRKICTGIKENLLKYNVSADVEIGSYANKDSYDKWIVKFDGSCGSEVTSTPLTWDTAWQLDVVAGAMWKSGCRTNPQCGLHVHHAFPDLSATEIESIWLHWAAFEPLIMAMVAKHRLHNDYAKLLLSYNRLQSFSGLYTQVASRGVRYCAEYAERYRTLNITQWWRTGRIEVRAHHGTLNPTDMKCWIMFTERFIAASREIVDRSVLETIANKPAKNQLDNLRSLLSFHSVDGVEELMAQVKELIQRRNPRILEVTNDNLSGY